VISDPSFRPPPWAGPPPRVWGPGCGARAASHWSCGRRWPPPRRPRPPASASSSRGPPAAARATGPVRPPPPGEGLIDRPSAPSGGCVVHSPSVVIWIRLFWLLSDVTQGRPRGWDFVVDAVLRAAGLTWLPEPLAAAAAAVPDAHWADRFCRINAATGAPPTPPPPLSFPSTCLRGRGRWSWKVLPLPPPSRWQGRHTRRPSPPSSGVGATASCPGPRLTACVPHPIVVPFWG